MTIDLNKICRLCLQSVKSDKELIEIFNNDESCSLPMRILACSTLEVKQNDSLPKSMCKECRYDLEKSYLFRIKSKNADSKLRRHLRLVNSGKVSNVFQEQDDDELEESFAFLAKWETEQLMITTAQNSLNQSQVQRFDMENCLQENKEYSTTLMVEELSSDYYENYEMLDDVINLQLVNSGKVNNVFQEADDKECEEAFAFPKRVTEQETKPTAQNNLNQPHVQQFDVDNSLQELVFKPGPILQCNQMDDCGSTEIQDTEDSTTLIVEELADYYEVYEMLDDVTHFRLVDSGKVSNVFQEEDDKECEESIAILTKWETEQVTKPTAQKILSESQLQRFEVDNSFQELIIKHGPNPKHNPTDDCDSTEIEDKEYSTTLMVEESTDCYEDYEMLDDVTNNYPSMYDEQKESENAHITEREQRHYILSGDEQIEIHLVEPETESDTQKDDAGYTNTEYLEIDEEDVGDDDKIMPGEFPYREGVDCKVYRKIDILESENSNITFYSTSVLEIPTMKLYKCKQCSKAFQYASGLSRHSLVHAGRKFECGICSKLFSDSSSKKRHETSFHNRNRM